MASSRAVRNSVCQPSKPLLDNTVSHGRTQPPYDSPLLMKERGLGVPNRSEGSSTDGDGIGGEVCRVVHGPALELNLWFPIRIRSVLQLGGPRSLGALQELPGGAVTAAQYLRPHHQVRERLRKPLFHGIAGIAGHQMVSAFLGAPQACETRPLIFGEHVGPDVMAVLMRKDYARALFIQGLAQRNGGRVVLIVAAIQVAAVHDRRGVFGVLIAAGAFHQRIHLAVGNLPHKEGAIDLPGIRDPVVDALPQRSMRRSFGNAQTDCMGCRQPIDRSRDPEKTADDKYAEGRSAPPRVSETRRWHHCFATPGSVEFTTVAANGATFMDCSAKFPRAVAGWRGWQQDLKSVANLSSSSLYTRYTSFWRICSGRFLRYRRIYLNLDRTEREGYVGRYMTRYSEPAFIARYSIRLSGLKRGTSFPILSILRPPDRPQQPATSGPSWRYKPGACRPG